MRQAVFRALADANRRSMFESLSQSGAGTATGLAGDLGISRQAAAKHLGLLVDAGLLVTERAGRETRYRPDPAPLHDLVAWVDQVESAWHLRLTALTESLDPDLVL